MARYVRLTVVYDMDDEAKPLGDEAMDWEKGRITIGDIEAGSWELVPIDAEKAKEWLGITRRNHKIVI